MDGLQSVIMFPALFVLIFLGIPVAFSLIIVGAIFSYLALGANAGFQMHGALATVASNFTLAAIPLFIFMGALLERSKIATNLLNALGSILGSLPGGLAVAVVVICAIFAASSGVVGAVEIMIGIMAVPSLLKARYKNDLICGTICAGGSLGTIIPPSIIPIIYATSADLSVGDLFAGILLPGLIMTGLFIIYIITRCTLRPQDGPPITLAESTITTRGQRFWLLVTALLPPVVLIVLVLGSIFAGIASPTEAAAVGAFGVLALTILYRQLTFDLLVDAGMQTVSITAMTLLIVVGGTLFSSAFLMNGGSTVVRIVIDSLDLGISGTMLSFIVVIFVLGFVLDWIAILLIMIPIFNPFIIQSNIDPIWFAVLVCVVLQTSYLSPPMAPSIFYLQTIVPPEIKLADMYRGVVPFVLLQFVTLLIVYLVPGIATYMPTILFRI